MEKFYESFSEFEASINEAVLTEVWVIGIQDPNNSGGKKYAQVILGVMSTQKKSSAGVIKASRAFGKGHPDIFITSRRVDLNKSYNESYLTEATSEVWVVCKSIDKWPKDTGDRDVMVIYGIYTNQDEANTEAKKIKGVAAWYKLNEVR